MTKFPDQMKCIFSNYTIVFLHVFKGLEYLHNKRIVHGDVKGFNSRILHANSNSLVGLRFA